MLRLFLLCVAFCVVRCDDDPQLDQMVDELYGGIARFQATTLLSDVLGMGDKDILQTVLQKVSTREDDNSEFSLDSVTFQLMKLTWWNRTDGQPQLANSTCDKLMDTDEELEELDTLTRAVITECMHNRLRIDALRMAMPELYWVPQDLLTNPWRKYAFGADLVKSALVYWQYTCDIIVDLDQLQNGTYVSQWKVMGLNVSHYAIMGQTQEEVDEYWASRSDTLAGYMQWNGAGQQNAVVWLLNETVSWRKRTPIDEVTAMANFFETLAKAIQLPTPY